MFMTNIELVDIWKEGTNTALPGENPLTGQEHIIWSLLHTAGRLRTRTRGFGVVPNGPSGYSIKVLISAT